MMWVADGGKSQISQEGDPAAWRLDQMDCSPSHFIGFLLAPPHGGIGCCRAASLMLPFHGRFEGHLYLLSFFQDFPPPVRLLTTVSECTMRASWAPAFPVLVSIQTYYGRLAVSQGTGSWALCVNDSCLETRIADPPTTLSTPVALRLLHVKANTTVSAALTVSQQS